MKQAEANSKQDKATQAEAEFARLLQAVQIRGYFGTATLTLNLQDGCVQHLRIATERLVK